MSQSVRVDLAGAAYEVVVGPGLVDQAANWITPLLRRPMVAIVMDQTVSDLHGPRLIGALEAAGVRAQPIILPPGEETKSFDHLAQLCDALLVLELDRGDMIIAFGGGVIGDLTGFAAAIYKRGVDFIQISHHPIGAGRSLLVGGKTAIDTARGKNLIGAFHQPRLVLADLAMLDTLPARERRCGYGEVLKYGLLGDAEFFEWLEDHGAAVLDREPEALGKAVRRSVEMKADIVAADEREGGARALLNLGHTFAHAIEAVTGFGEVVKHGEAVGLGCAMKPSAFPPNWLRPRHAERAASRPWPPPACLPDLRTCTQGRSAPKA